MSDVERPDRLDETAIAKRRREVADLYLRRQTQTRIAEHLGVSQQTVSDDIAAMRAQWREEHRGDIEQVIDRELEELSQMERDCAVQFVATKDVHWILARLKTKERRAKMLGLDAPARIDATSAGQAIGGGYVTEALLVALAPFPEARAAAATALLALEEPDAGG